MLDEAPMADRRELRPRRIARLAVLLILGGCDGGAAFQTCWVPQLSFSSDDAGSPARTTAAYVRAAPTRETAQAPNDESTVPPSDEPLSAPQGTYYRIPALPEPASAAQGGTTYGGGAVTPGGAPAAPHAGNTPTTPGQTGTAGTEEEAPASSEARAPGEMVVLPVYPGVRRAEETPGLVMPGVRPPVAAGEQAPESQPRAEQLPPATAATPLAPHVAPGPVNFRVPAPPPAPVIP
jgi:hypothetical protein